MSQITRIVHDIDDTSRTTDVDTGTVVLEAAPTPAEPLSYRELFIEHHASFLRAFDAALEPGIVLAAVQSTSGRVACMSLQARTERANAAIIGRHTRADLRLRGDDSVPLRHIAAVTFPHDPAGQTAPRVLLADLHTSQGFEDETGALRLAVLTEGPCLLRSGDHAVYCLPARLARGLPTDPERAWEALPERVHLERTRGIRPADTGMRTAAAPVRSGPGQGTVSRVMPVQPPVMLDPERLLERDEAPLGELAIHTRTGTHRTLQVGRQALRRGVLVGRYERCVTPVLRSIELDSISRVHLLLIELDGRHHAIDTASRNGVFADGEPVRVIALEHGTRLDLAAEAAILHWRLLN